MSNQGLMSGRSQNYGSTSDNAEVGFAGPSSGTGFFDAAQFYLLCDQITSNVFAIAKHGNQQGFLSKFGSKYNGSNIHFVF